MVHYFGNEKMNELITRKESTRYPGLFVKKYKKKVFFDNLWNESDELLEARGHVETEDGKIVIRPLTKIFNRGENGTDINRDEEVIAVQKINGFMACATYVPEVGEVVVSTTGSLDSDFVKMAEVYINERVKGRICDYWLAGSNLTYIFEIVHPEDPHIIQEKPGAYLLGARPVLDNAPYMSSINHEQYLDDLAVEMGVMRPHWSSVRFSDITDIMKDVRHEGFVVYGQESGTVLKIKSPYYLCLKAAARKKDIMSLDKSRVDEEFYGLIDHIKQNQEEFNALGEQARLEYMRNYLEK